MYNPGKKEQRLIFAWGFCLGIICFLLTYGVYVLDFQNDGWLFRADTDLKQHYIGWCHFRTSAWTFPVGMIDSLSFPTPVSVIYTDSIPLFALFFKLFRSILPETFQYFGLFGILCFGLQGAFSALLLRKVTKQKLIYLTMPLVFIMSFPMLHRMFYHTSLGAQWIILLAFYLWTEGIQYKSVKKQALVWGGMSVLCVLIHTYFLPMIACIMCGTMLHRLLQEKGKVRKQLKEILPILAAFVLPAAALMAILGAFTGHSSADYGVGEFGMNLNSFVNSLGYGRFLPKLPLYYQTQYEGYAYWGLGMLLLASVLFIYGIFIYRKEKAFVLSPGKKAILTVVVIFVLVSVCPVISLNGHLFVKIPYTKQMIQLIGTFRSNGRFIWPVLYLGFLWTAAMLDRINEKRVVALLLIGCLLLQVADVSAYAAKKRKRFNKEPRKYIPDWDLPELNAVIDNYKHFILMYDSNNMAMTTAYYAYYHDMTLNRFYYARNIDEIVEMTLTQYEEELKKGMPEKDCIYIMDENLYEQYKDSGLYFYAGESCIYGTAQPVTGLEELNNENRNLIEWE